MAAPARSAYFALAGDCCSVVLAQPQILSDEARRIAANIAKLPELLRKD